MIENALIRAVDAGGAARRRFESAVAAHPWLLVPIFAAIIWLSGEPV